MPGWGCGSHTPRTPPAAPARRRCQLGSLLPEQRYKNASNATARRGYLAVPRVAPQCHPRPVWPPQLAESTPSDYSSHGPEPPNLFGSRLGAAAGARRGSSPGLQRLRGPGLGRDVPGQRWHRGLARVCCGSSVLQTRSEPGSLRRVLHRQRSLQPPLPGDAHPDRGRRDSLSGARLTLCLPSGAVTCAPAAPSAPSSWHIWVLSTGSSCSLRAGSVRPEPRAATGG